MDPLSILSSLQPVWRFSKLEASTQDMGRSRKLKQKSQNRSSHFSKGVVSGLKPLALAEHTLVGHRTAGREESLETDIQVLKEKSLSQLCVRQGQEPVKPLQLLLHWLQQSLCWVELSWASLECSVLLGAARLQSGDRQHFPNKLANQNYRPVLNLQPFSLTYLLSYHVLFLCFNWLAASLGNVPAHDAVVGWEVWRRTPSTSPSYRDITVERWGAPPAPFNLVGLSVGFFFLSGSFTLD